MKHLLRLPFSREAQAWGAGRSIVSESDRRDLKKARKDGRLAEAMLDRRAALKRSVSGNISFRVFS
jgi:protein FRG1